MQRENMIELDISLDNIIDKIDAFLALTEKKDRVLIILLIMPQRYMLSQIR